MGKVFLYPDWSVIGYRFNMGGGMTLDEAVLFIKGQLLKRVNRWRLAAANTLTPWINECFICSISLQHLYLQCLEYIRQALLQQLKTFGSFQLLMSTEFLFYKWCSFLSSFMIILKKTFQECQTVVDFSTYQCVIMNMYYFFLQLMLHLRGRKCQIVLEALIAFYSKTMSSA